MLQVAVSSCSAYEEVAILNDRLLRSLGVEPVFISDGPLKVEASQITSLSNLWSDRLADGLERLSSDFVMLLLEDYFILQTQLPNELWSIPEVMKAEGLEYVRLVNIPTNVGTRSLTLCPIPTGDFYAVNLQPAIWSRTRLMSILRASPGNPWQVEVGLKSYFPEEAGRHSRCAVFEANLVLYNGVIKGKWQRDFDKVLGDFVELEGVDFRLKRMSAVATFTYALRQRISSYVVGRPYSKFIFAASRLFRFKTFREY